MSRNVCLISQKWSKYRNLENQLKFALIDIELEWGLNAFLHIDIDFESYSPTNFSWFLAISYEIFYSKLD